MTICTLIRTRGNSVKLQLRTSSPLAAGAVLGGLLGQKLFELVRAGFGRENILGAIQAALLTVIMLLVMFYICNKGNLPSKHIVRFPAVAAIGLCLGLTSSFLGIGGGPYNVAALFFLFYGCQNRSKNSLYIIYIIAFSQLASIASAAAANSIPAFAPVDLASMTVGGIGGALLGAAISKRLDNRGVEKLLKVLALFIAAVDFYNIFRFAIQ